MIREIGEERNQTLLLLPTGSAGVKKKLVKYRYYFLTLLSGRGGGGTAAGARAALQDRVVVRNSADFGGLMGREQNPGGVRHCPGDTDEMHNR